MLELIMPPKSKLKLIPLNQKEPIGKRLARIRREKGLTQTQLAEKIGTIQVIISDYERGRTRLQADMTIRLAAALRVSTDDILGLTKNKQEVSVADHRFLKRLEQIQKLSERDQQALLRTIDAYLSKAI